MFEVRHKRPNLPASLVSCHLGRKPKGQLVKFNHTSRFNHSFPIDLEPISKQHLDILRMKNGMKPAKVVGDFDLRDPAAHARAPNGSIQDSRVESSCCPILWINLQLATAWRM